MRTVAAIPAIGLLAGSGLGFIFADGVARPAYVVLALSVALAAWGWRARRPQLGAAAVAIGFAAGGALLAADAWQRAWRPAVRVRFEALARAERARASTAHRALPVDDEAAAVVVGVLRADAAETEAGVSLSLDAEELRPLDGDAPDAAVVSDGVSNGVSGGVSGGVLVSVAGTLAPAHLAEWRAGRRVRMPLRLHRPSRYLDPGVADGERALARRGISLVGTVKSGALVEVLGLGPWWEEAASRVRLFARTAIGRAVGRWSPRSAGIVAAIVIGDRVGLDRDVQRRLQEAGTYHVIAISGGNIAILAGLLLLVCRFAGVLGRAAMLWAILLLVAYAYLVGGGASVSRATLSAVAAFAARAWDQRGPPLNTFWAVVAALVVCAPLSSIDPAFLLTCGATLGILVGVPALVEGIGERPRVVTAAATMAAASLAAEAVLLPIGALMFSRVTFAGLVLNFLAIPLMGIAQLAGMVVVPLAVVSTSAASVAGALAHVGAAGLVWSADLVRYIPQATFRVAPPGWTSVGLYYGGLVWGWTGRPGARVAWLTAALAGVWMVAEPWAWRAAQGDGRLHVTFLDVGQGDSAFVRFPHGATMLVDAGGVGRSSSFDIGDRVVAPVLRDAGVRRLDYLVVSHGDPDHIGGAAAIVREFRPREVWEGIPVPSFGPLVALRQESQSVGARWANVYDTDHLRVDDVEITARHPRRAEWERRRVRNDDSLVLELVWRDVSLLFTGDIGAPVERTLAPGGTGTGLQVLKVPHHGSLTSSSREFLQHLAPDAAIVSAGRANHFGHPAPDVLSRYAEIGTAIFRTDLDGAVVLDTDGHTLDLRAFTGRNLVVPGAQAHHDHGP